MNVMNVEAKPTGGLAIPFDHHRLDRLMDEAGIDVVLATSKHNAEYLTGGHRANFFDAMDATGVTRYLPVLVYPKGAPEKGGLYRPSPGVLSAPGASAVDAGNEHDVERLGRRHAEGDRPYQEDRHDAEDDRHRVRLPALRRGAGAARRVSRRKWVDALYVLERQRLLKSPKELKMLKYASDAVIDAMLDVIVHTGPGKTKAAVTEELRREEVLRGLNFEYCLITAGTSLNRAPSDQVWGEGDIMSLDSGGNYHGYIGDVCRMAIQGEPDAELEDLLDEIESIQRAAFKAVKPGAMGGAIYAAATPLVARSKHHNNLDFVAHGMGLVSHEGPRLTNSGPVPYPATDADKPLEPGMVISIETTLKHPSRGFIKLEDTVVVTGSGHEIYGEGARGWNKAGTQASRITWR